MRRGTTMRLWVLMVGVASLAAIGDRCWVSAEFYVGEYRTWTGRAADEGSNEIASFQSRHLKVDRDRHVANGGTKSVPSFYVTFR